MTAPGEVQLFRTSGGARIYRLPVEAFPELWAYVHLVLAGEWAVLIDTGSGFGDSNDHLDAGIEAVRLKFGESLRFEDLTHVLITHAHIDHFGGLPHVIARSNPSIGVHELDLRVLTRFEERLVVVAGRLGTFLAEAGVAPAERKRLLDLYRLNKHLFSSVAVDFAYEAAGMRVGPFHLLHVPGHGPGHVVIRLDDILFSGDHVLKGISPHQAPERLTLNSGLGHYLDSLDRLEGWAGDVRLTLGGHEGPIDDLPTRLHQIRRLHEDRLEEVFNLLDRPRTIAGVADSLFPEARGYHTLLALEEAGAHVEYLAQRGHLILANLDELESDPSVPLMYSRQTTGPGRSFMRRDEPRATVESCIRGRSAARPNS